MPSYWKRKAKTRSEELRDKSKMVKNNITARFLMPSVYLAGKISEYNWRHQYMFKYDRWDEAAEDWAKVGMWDQVNSDAKVCPPAFYGKRVDLGNWYNVGPFFISDRDHGYGVEGEHGIRYPRPSPNAKHEPELLGMNEDTRIQVRDRHVSSLCLNAIQSCDILFAWVDTLDCFGTISEIGFAKGHSWSREVAGGRAIKIVIASPKEMRDMWFVYEYVDEHNGDVTFDFDNPADALEYFLDKYIEKPDPKVVYKDYIKSPEWRIKSTAAKEAAGNACQVCNASGVTLDTHHRTYDNLGDEKDGDLVVLCRDCHTVFHKAKKVKGQY